ncbi:hypothetical protein [Paenibacillus hamazuiensis]|uniref:hypothetical protein n=1 Tax=Paenibacillus hamazuiensis TaxID=2936508 RepID=UPI00200DB651|nr:hypothetical protein [Paenibacillus hamazuiensis]
MRMLLGFIVIVLMAFAAACSVPVGQGDKIGGAGQNNKVLFVGKDEGGDAITIKHLKGLGLEVTVVSDKELTADGALKYGLVFVSSSTGSHRVGNKLLAAPVPVIYAKAKILGEVGLADKSDTEYGDFIGRSIAIKAADHPLAAGFTGSVDVFKSDGSLGYVLPQGGLIIAAAPDDERKAVICAFDKGAKNLRGEPVPARRMYFNLSGGEEVNLTENGWKLFETAVKWAMSGN